MKNNIDEKIIIGINTVFSYANHIDDWIIIKKELLKTLNPIERKQFSTRDPITKKQTMNSLEDDIALLWESKTGRKVIFKKDDKPK